MSRTFTETLGMVQSLMGFIQDPTIQAALTAKGYDVTSQIMSLQAAIDSMSSLNAEQEQLKSTLKAKTVEVETATNTADSSASSLIDAIAGLLGKTTPDGKRVLEIRSSIRRGPNDGGGGPTP